MIEKDPSKYALVEEVGMELMKAEKWKAAEDFLKMAAEASAKLGVDSAAVYSNIGIAAFNQRKDDPAKIDEAISYYQKALDRAARRPDDRLQRDDRVHGERGLGRPPHAGERSTCSISPSDPKGWQLLARCYSEAATPTRRPRPWGAIQDLKGQ